MYIVTCKFRTILKMGNVTYRATENMSKKFGHLVHLKNLHYFSEIYTKPLHVDKIVCRMKVKIEDLNLTIECHTCNCKLKKKCFRNYHCQYQYHTSQSPCKTRFQNLHFVVFKISTWRELPSVPTKTNSLRRGSRFLRNYTNTYPVKIH